MAVEATNVLTIKTTGTGNCGVPGFYGQNICSVSGNLIVFNHFIFGPLWHTFLKKHYDRIVYSALRNVRLAKVIQIVSR